MMMRRLLLAALVALLLPGAALAAAGWATFRSETGRFTVLMPGTPAEATETLEDGVVHRFVSSPEKGRAFVVVYGDDAEFASMPPDELFDNVRDALLDAAGASRQSERAVEFGGRPARELVAQGPEGSMMKARLILAGERLYTLLAVTPKDEAAIADADRFLGSFALISR
jgi:hypothetical protein